MEKSGTKDTSSISAHELRLEDSWGYDFVRTPAVALAVDLPDFGDLSISMQQVRMQFLGDSLRGALVGSASHVDVKPYSFCTGTGFVLIFPLNRTRGSDFAIELAENLQGKAANFRGMSLRFGIHVEDIAELGGREDSTMFVGEIARQAYRILELGDAGHILISRAAVSSIVDRRYLQRTRRLPIPTDSPMQSLVIFNYSTPRNLPESVGEPRMPARLRESVLQSSIVIAMEVMSRICVDIEQLPEVARLTKKLRLKPIDRFRATILLYQRHTNDFFISPLRVTRRKLSKVSPLTTAPMRGVLAEAWESGLEEFRSAIAVCPPKFNGNKEQYYLYWEKRGVDRSLVERFGRKGRFYMYVPLLKGRVRFGVLVIDAMTPDIRRPLFKKVVSVVDENIGCLEACFRHPSQI